MNPKDFIEQLKDYADIADASYAMLHYVEENEVFDIDDDKFRANNTAFELQGRWVYADGIKLGYKIKEEHINKSNLAKQLFNDKKIKLEQPTAYALTIEARFSQNIKIKKPSKDKPEKIDNEIQNFINRPDDDADISKQTLLVATNKSQQDENPDLTHILSPPPHQILHFSLWDTPSSA